jgi:anti-sigma B factor antagonist
MENTNIKYEILDNSRGIALVYAPEKLIGGREAFDFASITNLQSEINIHLEFALQQLILDLSKVIALNSSGLGSLVALHRELNAKSIAFAIFNPSAKVQEILKITRLDQVFQIVDNINNL